MLSGVMDNKPGQMKVTVFDLGQALLRGQALQHLRCCLESA
jgi:hypothetical protein